MLVQRTLSAALGGCKELALFETFALRPNKPLSAKDIERMSGLAWATIHRRLKDWSQLGLIREVHKEGKAQFYQLNRSNPSAAALVRAVNIGAAELIQAELAHRGTLRGDLEHPDARVVEVAQWRTDPMRRSGWVLLQMQEVRLGTIQEEIVHLSA